MSFLSVPGQTEKTSPGNVLKYSPDQERDDAGRFGSGGGGASRTSRKPLGGAEGRAEGIQEVLRAKPDKELSRMLDQTRELMGAAHAQQNGKALAELQRREAEIIDARASKLPKGKGK